MSTGSRRRCPRALATGAAVLLLAGCGAASAEVTGPFGPSSPTAPPVGRLLWVGDAETGNLSQYQNTPWNIVGGIPPKVVEDPVRHGQHAIEVSIPGATSSGEGICCGSRDEIVPNFRDIVPGDDLYFAFSTYLAPGFPVQEEWQVITQFKQNFDGSPPLTLNVEQGQYKVEGGYGHPGGSKQFIVNIGQATTGVWATWLMHVKFSPDPAVGFVEVWRDGAIVLPRYAPPGGTMYPNPNGPVASYVKTGYYRDAGIKEPGTIYYDDWAIGTSEAMVTH